MNSLLRALAALVWLIFWILFLALLAGIFLGVSNL